MWQMPEGFALYLRLFIALETLLSSAFAPSYELYFALLPSREEVLLLT